MGPSTVDTGEPASPEPANPVRPTACRPVGCDRFLGAAGSRRGYAVTPYTLLGNYCSASGVATRGVAVGAWPLADWSSTWAWAALRLIASTPLRALLLLVAISWPSSASILKR